MEHKTYLDIKYLPGMVMFCTTPTEAFPEQVIREAQEAIEKAMKKGD